MTPMPNIAMPVPASSGGNDSYSSDWDVDSRAPPPIPCTTRQKMSMPNDPAAPQKKEASTKSRIEPVK